MRLERDMDLIRELLLKMEAGENNFKTLSSSMAHALGVDLDEELSEDDAHRLAYHLKLLAQAGLIEVAFPSGGGDVHVRA